MIDIALKNVFRQRARSALTILGIAIGIGLILSLGAIGEGLNRQIEQSFGNIGGFIEVRQGEDASGISDDNIADIEAIQGVDSVIPIGEYRITRGGGEFGGFFSRTAGGVGRSLTFTGVFPDDLDALIGEQIDVDDGRKIDGSDDGEYVVMLGSSIAQSQLLNIGDEVEYDKSNDGETESYYFEVVGILEASGDDSIDGAAYVPLKTMQELEDDDTITRVRVKVKDVSLVEQIADEINEMEDVRAFSPLSMVRTLEDTLGTLQLAVYGIGVISLIVGGIGVMNTMIMSVMERRREIGVMKAIGATTSNILVQVLEESAFISLIGGTMGLLLGFGSSSLISEYTSFSTVITGELVGIAIGFSLLLGMGAGLYPAWAASQLDPIEVLRYE